MELVTKILSVGSTALLFVALALFVVKYGVKAYYSVKQQIGRARIARRQAREQEENEKRDR